MSEQTVPNKKVCASCKRSKSLNQFYTRSGQPQYRVSECIACMKKRNKSPLKLAEGETSVATERDVMQLLAFAGIPSLPGRDLRIKRVDVVAWGCVKIEVKSARVHKDGTYTFALTERQKQVGVRGDLIVLVCKREGGNTYHVFPVEHPVFYNEDERKRYVIYKPEAKHRKSTHRGKAITHLTLELMVEHENAWQWVETVRQQKSLLLREQVA